MLLGALTACALSVAGVSGASAATHPVKPSAKSFLLKGSATSGSGVKAFADTGSGSGVDAGEARSVQLRGEFQQSITAAPAFQAPAAGLVAAQHAASSLPTAGGHWYEVTAKPFVNDPIPRGANYGTGWGDVSGRLTSLTHSGSVVFAGSASGGVWRSSDGGAHFTPVNDGLPRLSVGALATDPRDGSVWVATGEGNNSSESQYGVGVYRLARGASTWKQVGGPELYGAGSYRIVWIGGYVYVATTKGLYRRPAGSTSGRAWQAVLQPAGPKTYPPSSAVTDVIAVPGTGGHLILGVVGWAGYTTPPADEANGFYVGTGSAGSFHRITPKGDIDPTTIGRTSFSSSGHRLYAVVESTATGDLRGQGVYVSPSGDPRGPWTRIADVDKLAASGSALGDSTSGYFPGVQADYNQYVLADPTNPNHLYLGLEEVFESTDGGATWNTVGPYWNVGISCDVDGTTPYNCPQTTHPDQHAAMIFAGRLWAGNDGGAWKRPLNVHVRGSWTNLNATLHTTQNYSIAVGKVAGGLAYWGGLQDNGESYTTTTSPDVQQAFTGDGGDTIVDPANGNRAVEEYTNLDMYVTTDGATNDLREISPSCLTATNPPAVCDPNPRFIAPIEQDVKDPTHWVAGGQYVWDDTAGWSTVCDGASGCDWKKVYDTGAGHQVTALADNGATTYAAWCGSCNPGSFQRGLATNYGGAWHELSLAGVPSRYITSVAVDPKDAAHVIISIGSYSRRWIPNAGYGHVFESRNGGRTWTDDSGNLPDAPVYKVALAGQKLVVGTEVGAFVGRTSPYGARWARLGTGLPNVTVWDLTVTPTGAVVAGTHGRGDWKVQLH
ncbi:MAG TPA: hypothetical protein VIG76_00945 [Amnibacterium sp.]|jgi:hypothetical protein|uniref:WD40/YVTN/BNR-like repeat-containing protein n=1 Tax=Amnibacterium sp. TaxID=1872496 RepID=UPI002F94C3CB